MLIKTQNGLNIFDVKSITTKPNFIYYSEDGKEHNVFRIEGALENEKIILGDYKNEMKVKQIINEIQISVEKNRVYSMP